MVIIRNWFESPQEQEGRASLRNRKALGCSLSLSLSPLNSTTRHAFSFLEGKGESQETECGRKIQKGEGGQKGAGWLRIKALMKFHFICL